MKHSKHVHVEHPRKKILLKIVFGVLILIGLWNVWKPLPKEINTAWGTRHITSSDITLLADTTYVDTKGVRVQDQEIFDEVLSMIRNAKSYIFIDMFLWNDFGVDPSKVHRALSSELTNALIAKKKENPDIVIQVVSDPINTVYGGQPAAYFSSMEAVGISVIMTNLPALRDSNPVLSSVWRLFVYPFEYLHQRIIGAPYTIRVVPNILDSDGENVTVRSYLSLLNFKANHRKLIVTDEQKARKVGLVSLVTSANPHDGSSSHSNVALKVKGSIAYDILESEKRIVEMAGKTFIAPRKADVKDDQKDVRGEIEAKLITDRAILDAVVATIHTTQEGDTVDLLMFYLSDRHVIKELIDAANRGVIIRLILDPNKDAFGKQKNGIPNREVADTLVTKGKGNISIKWCDTHGEQCHGKMLVVKQASGYAVTLGSANFTRRNIGGYNLESNIILTSFSIFPAWKEADDYFDALWNNTQGTFSTNYETYKDISVFKKVVAWIMENTGLGTF